MVFLNWWQGRTGRLDYLIALVIASSVIAVLPFIAGKITTAFPGGGMDRALAVVRMLLFPLLAAIGLIITAIPLIIFARRRMRELGLSGVWLLLFPIGPLQMLFAVAIESTYRGIWPLPVTSPVLALPFWVELAFGASLAVLPAGDHLAQSGNRILKLMHLATTCEGRLSRGSFAVHLAIAIALTIGLTIVLGAFAASGSIGGFARPSEHSVSIVAGVVASASALLTIFVTMFLTSSTIRRLHDLNQRGWWIILFPFGLIALSSVFAFFYLTNLQLVPLLLLDPFYLLLNPFYMLSIVQGLGCVILLAWLLAKRGSDLDNPYGSPASPPHHGYLPA